MQVRNQAGDETESKTLWSFQYLLIMLINFFIYITHYILLSLLPLYALHIGGKYTDAGLMTGLFALSALIFRPVFGRLLDKKGRKPVILLGLAFIIIVSLAYNYFCQTMMSLYVFRLINGIGFSAGTTAATTAAADIVPKKRMAEGIGYFGVSNTVAQAIGPLLGLFIINRAGYNAMFLSVTVLAVAGLTCVFFIRYPCREKRPMDSDIGDGARTKDSSPAPQTLFFLLSTLLPTALVMLFVTTANGAVQTFVAKYGFSLGIDDIGVFFTAFAIATFFSRIASGKLSYRLGQGETLLLGVSLMFLSQLTLIFAVNLRVFLTAAVFYGLGLGITLPSLNTIMILLSPENRKGAAVAVYFSSMDIGIGGGAMVWGLVSQAYGFPAVYACSSCCCIISILIYFLVLHKQLKERLKSQAVLF